LQVRKSAVIIICASKRKQKGDFMKRKTKKMLETIGYIIGAITIILLIYGIIQVALK